MASLIDQLLDLVFPPRCAGCRVWGTLLCECCRAACRVVSATDNQRLHRQLATTVLASTLGAYRFDGPMRSVIHALKYQRRRRMAPILGQMLAPFVLQQSIAVDLIVPVPLHPARQRERGFNQAALLATELSQHLALPVGTSLVRVRHTAQQTGLDHRARQANVQDAFAWRGAPPPPHVLLLDDVLTTGATLSAAAAALRTAGAVEVHGLALARGVMPGHQRHQPVARPLG